MCQFRSKYTIHLSLGNHTLLKGNQEDIKCVQLPAWLPAVLTPRCCQPHSEVLNTESPVRKQTEHNDCNCYIQLDAKVHHPVAFCPHMCFFCANLMTETNPDRWVQVWSIDRALCHQTSNDYHAVQLYFRFNSLSCWAVRRWMKANRTAENLVAELPCAQVQRS